MTSPAEATEPDTSTRHEASGAGVTLAHAGVVVTLLVILLISWFAREVLLLAFAGVLIAVFLRILARWVHRHTRLPIGVSLAAVVIVLLGSR